MNKVQELIQPLYAAYNRLTQREQMIVLGSVLGGFAVILILVGAGVSAAIAGTEHRVRIKSEQLAQVIQLQDEYKARKRQWENQLRELGRSNIRLVSMVEEAAKQTGVEIGQLRPEDSEPSSDGVVESRVDLRVQNLSIDRLQNFLTRLEENKSFVVIRRMKIEKPYRKETLDVELTITNFKLKSS